METKKEQIHRIETVPEKLTDAPKDLRYLFRLHTEAGKAGSPIALDLSRCRVLSHAAIALVLSSQQRLKFDFRTMNIRLLEKVAGHLSWGLNETHVDPASLHAVPLKRFTNRDDVLKYLEEHWLGPGWVNMSDSLKGALIGRTYEMFNNGFLHSGSGSVFSCGEHLKAAKRLKLAIVDFGLGIPGTVGPYLKEKYKLPFAPSDEVCMDWAMRPRMTTKPGQGHEGIGLDLLREMVELNQGRLDVFSHNGHVEVTKNGLRVHRSATHFAGTLVNISFQCDDGYYSFLNEDDDDEPLF